MCSNTKQISNVNLFSIDVLYGFFQVCQSIGKQLLIRSSTGLPANKEAPVSKYLGVQAYRERPGLFQIVYTIYSPKV